MVDWLCGLAVIISVIVFQVLLYRSCQKALDETWGARRRALRIHDERLLAAAGRLLNLCGQLQEEHGIAWEDFRDDWRQAQLELSCAVIRAKHARSG